MSAAESVESQVRLKIGAEGAAWELPEVGLRGTALHPITTAESVDYVLDELDAGRGGWLLASNLGHLRRVRKDPGYREMYGSASLRVPAGSVLGWACRLQRTPLPACTRLSHLLSDMTREATQAGRRIFLICESEDFAKSAVVNLKARFEGVQLVGATSIVHAAQNDDLMEFARIARAIVQADPDIVYVGLDSPFQEYLINFLRRDRPKTWWVGLGYELKRLAIGKRAASDWMTRLGIDWLQRLPGEPGRMLRRHVIEGLPTALAVLGRSLLRGIVPKGKTATRYGRRKPRALLVDDDEHALAHLELLLSTRFPQLDIHARTQPDVSGGYEFYFIDNDFDGQHLASELAAHIREAQPESMIFAFSGVLDIDTLKALINVGCDGVCDKSDPKSWKAILDLIEERLQQMIKRHAGDGLAFGGIRGSAQSIQRLLKHWNNKSAGSEHEGKQQSG